MNKEYIALPSGAILEIWNANYSRLDPVTILFYPGSLIGPNQYDYILRLLWETGLNIAAIHLTGHGNARDKKAPRSFEEMLEQGLEAETWLIKNLSGSIAACGHSQGGILTLAHASRSRSLRAAFALGAVFPHLPAAIRLTNFASFADKRAKILAIFRKLADFLPYFPFLFPFYVSPFKLLANRQKPLYIGKGAGRWSYPLSFIYSLFSLELSEKVNCPFWLISAQDDDLFTREIIEETFRNIQAPQKTLVWLKNGGHLAPFNPLQAQCIMRVIFNALK